MISVCIATHNGERYIRRQIESILSQLGEDDEIVVSDDNSTDATLQIISEMADSRVKVVAYHREKSKYKGKFADCFYIRGNFQNALQNAQGDIILLSDQDDVWLPGKVEKYVKALQQVDFVISDCKVTDGDLKVIKDSFLEGRTLSQNPFRYILRVFFLGCTMGFTKHFKEKSLPFPNLPITHDAWLLLVLTRGFTYTVIPDACLLYRRHGNNASSASQKSKNSLSFKILSRIYMLFAYLVRALKIRRL